MKLSTCTCSIISHTPILETPIQNPERTLVSWSAQPDLLAEIMGLHLKDSHELVYKIQEVVTERNTRLMQESAHSLKSRSATLGAHRLAEACEQLDWQVAHSRLNKRNNGSTSSLRHLLRPVPCSARD